MTDTKTLPASVVKKDKTLRDKIAAGEEADRSLSELRWHWTANPDNPNRVTQRAYASATGVSHKTVGKSARAWASTLEPGGPKSVTEGKALDDLPKSRRDAVADKAKNEGMSIPKANEAVVRDEGRKEAADAYEAFEASLTEAVEKAIDDFGYKEDKLAREELVAIIKEEVRDARSDYVERKGSDDGFDAFATAWERVAARANARVKKETKPVDKKDGFDNLLVLMKKSVKALNKQDEELSRFRDLSDTQREALRVFGEDFKKVSATLAGTIEVKVEGVPDSPEGLEVEGGVFNE